MTQRNEETGEVAGEDELRANIRETLLDFAKDVAGAEDRGALIDVLTDVDEYVDRVVRSE